MQHANPASAAQHVQGYGRHGDTMLMHVSPSEVRGLQALAEAHGTTLTINPHTGMPEAFSLKKLLPTLIGAAAMFVPGLNAIVNPWTVGAVVGGVQGIATGSLKKGLMAGLGAYGGASLGGALSATTGIGAGAANAAGAAGTAGAAGAAAPVTAAAAPGAVSFVNTPASLAGATGLGAGQTAAGFIPGAPAFTVLKEAPGMVSGLTPTASAIGSNITPAGMGNIVGKTLGPNMGIYADKFSEAARAGLPSALKGGMVEKYAPALAGLGVLSNVSSAMAPKMPTMQTSDGKWNYAGPYKPPVREVRFVKDAVGRDPNDSSEFRYFTPTNPPGYVPIQQAAPTLNLGGGYAKGGMTLEDGAFVVDARTVSELGNGSSSAGQDILRRMGGEPIKGHGDGVSDSIRANIGGRQEARVARDEVKFSPEAVKRLGGGSAKRGSDKLYSLMAKAEKARKTAKRGQDTGLASLLGER